MDKKPRLRFKDFSNQWQKTILGKVVKYKKGYAFKSRDSVENDGIPVVKIGNFSNGFVDNNYGMYMPKSNKYTSSILRNGDILISTVGSWPVNMDSVVGQVSRFTARPETCLLNQNIVDIRTINNDLLNNLYLFYSIENRNFFKYIINTARGNANQASITLKSIFGYKLPIPSLSEQQKIGHFCALIDKLINLQQTKIKTLRKLKFGYLQKLFPSKNDSVPRLRFHGFTGKWQLKKLNDVTQITMGQSPYSRNYNHNKNDYILVQGNADINNGHITPRIHTSQITKLSNHGDIILTVRAPVGDVAINNYRSVVIGRGVTSIAGNSFIYAWLQHFQNSKGWLRYSTGSTFNSVNSHIIKNLQLHIPSLPEQQAIGKFFRNLDHEINLQQKKFNHLKNLKHAYLQKMFC